MLHRSLKYQFMIQDICMWFAKNHWEALSFQKDTWAAMIKGQSGMVTAPTGSGKTYSVLLGAIQYCQLKLKNPKPNGLFIIWICPIKALTKEIEI